MAALVIFDAVKQDLLPSLGDAAPQMIWDPTAALMKRIESGEAADGIFAIDGPMDQLAARGIIDVQSRRPIVQAEFGLAVRRGLDVEQPQNAAELVALLRTVPSIVYSRGGAI
jgi:molybdate transport system substrate-binding protein